MSVAVDEEEIFPGFAFAGARFDFGQVDAIAAEGSKRVVEGADFVADADHETGAIVAGGRTALAAEHEEARGVGGVILDVLFDYRQVVFFGGEKAGDGGGVLFTSGELGG